MNLHINPLLEKYCELSGYSEGAVRKKISSGKWVEGQQYIKAPDRKIKIILEGVDKWDRGQA